MKKNTPKYSTCINYKDILDFSNEDRRYNSVMDEYRRHYAFQKKTKVKHLNIDELWEFLLWFFKETYNLEINDNLTVGKKVFVQSPGSTIKKPMFVFWNNKHFEFALEERVEATNKIIFRIYPKKRNIKLVYRKTTHSPTTIWGLRGEISKFHFKYNHKRNAKSVFTNLKRLDQIKLKQGNIDKGFEQLLQMRVEEHQIEKEKILAKTKKRNKQ